ncbi:MAG: hypothetical protein Ct9H300mP11_21020 [Chloroflexota bacterium]|nr:MAG: hypothetical protein Ct9H300mP11_21020 [Chloroflexota bacterium]
MGGYAFLRVTYVAEDQQLLKKTPVSMDWVADLNGFRRTLKGGSEIYADLDNGGKLDPKTLLIMTLGSNLQPTLEHRAR